MESYDKRLGAKDMNLKSNIDIAKFLLEIQKCQGEVYYETSDGDRLNLSSTLSQYIFCTVASHSYDWSQGMICCKSEEDIPKLSPYLEESRA